jgi:probable rRNA maturation factor
MQDEPETPGPEEPDSTPHNLPGSHDAIQIDVVDRTEDQDRSALSDWLATHLRRAAVACDLDHVELTIAIVKDAEMAELHEQYTGVAGTTDVLTFDLLDSEQGDLATASNKPIRSIEGDIVVCLDEAQRQAELRGHETRDELLLYAVHGLMHLLGEDDHTEEDYQRMHAREDALLTELGFGPLFHSPHPER